MAACADTGGDPARWETASPSPADLTPSPTTPAEITLAFGGDVHFVESDGGVPNRTGRLLEEPESAFGPVAELFTEADVSMVNLETAVTTGGTPEPKTFHFRAPPEAFDAVRAAGVDVVSLANNHALDYGREGLADTLAYAQDRGVEVVGAGPDADAAYAAWVNEVRGTRIAYLGLSQVSELWESWRAGDDRAGVAYAMDGERAVDAVRAAAAAADVVVVYVHWGLEGEPCPSSQMESFARDLADAGADLVVGTHAHLLLGGGWSGSTYVHYGLGNFLWWRDDAFSNDTGVLWATVRGDRVESVELRPTVISRESGQPVPVTGQEADRVRDKIADRRGCTDLSAERAD